MNSIKGRSQLNYLQHAVKISSGIWTVKWRSEYKRRISMTNSDDKKLSEMNMEIFDACFKINGNETKVMHTWKKKTLA